jgi:DNA invertase Pin-like site-specific DNA recombinase
MTEKEKARRRRQKRRSKYGSSLAQLRATITLDALCYEIEKLLDAAGRDPSEWSRWSTNVLTQVRISRADLVGGGTSESPERQLKRIAKYCVRFQLHPVEMCFEAQSGHLTDLKPRHLFEDFRRRVADGSLEVQAVVTYNIDRFTRDKLIGEEWFRVLRLRGVDLYEAEDMKSPKSLEEMEDTFTSKLHGAWRESKRTSRRVREAHDDISDAGRLISGYNDAFGHDYIVQENEAGVPKRVGLRVLENEARWLREATERLHAGEALHNIVVDFDARGHIVSDNVLRRRLRAPRMCGLQKVQGRLKPANIEPILTEAQWRKNCELIREGTGTTHRKHALSNMLICGVCGHGMVGGAKNARGEPYYRCGKRALKNKRRCVCGRPDGRCRCKSLRGGKAADGHTHPTRLARVAERLIAEIVRLSYDDEKLAVYAAARLAEAEATESRRVALGEERKELLRRRQRVASLVARGLAEEEDVQEDLVAIADRLAVVAQEAARLAAHKRSRAQRVSYEEFTKRLNSEGPSYLRTQAELIIDHIVMTAIPNAQRPYDGLEVVFADSFPVSHELVDELVQHLNDELQAEQWLSRSHGPQLSLDIEDHIYTLWANSEMTPVEIARRLASDGIKTATGNDVWHTGPVTNAIRRACARRGVAYVTRRAAPSQFSSETRKLVYELCRERRPFEDVIADLERMGVTPKDGDWTPLRLRGVYAAECASRGDKPVGRRPHLPEEVRREVRLLVRAQGKSYQEAADWLNASGIRRPNGKDWDRRAVDSILQREKRRLNKS